jgi:hypothetical protein
MLLRVCKIDEFNEKTKKKEELKPPILNLADLNKKEQIAAISNSFWPS